MSTGPWPPQKLLRHPTYHPPLNVRDGETVMDALLRERQERWERDQQAEEALLRDIFATRPWWKRCLNCHIEATGIACWECFRGYLAGLATAAAAAIGTGLGAWALALIRRLL